VPYEEDEFRQDSKKDFKLKAKGKINSIGL
jgi:hypothetical protein